LVIELKQWKPTHDQFMPILKKDFIYRGWIENEATF